MGDEDMQCGNDKELRDSVAHLKKSYDDYRCLSYLQDCFIVQHSFEGTVTRTEYSDGSVMITDASTGRQILEKNGAAVWERCC